VRGGLTAVSCATGQYCAAVSGTGAMIRWNGSSWSAPSVVDRTGGGLTAVSCPAAGACTATDFAGRLLSLS